MFKTHYKRIPSLELKGLKMIVLSSRCYYSDQIEKTFNPIQDRGGAKRPPPFPTSFSPVTSTNVGSSPQNFLTFSFNPFDRLV